MKHTIYVLVALAMIFMPQSYADTKRNNKLLNELDEVIANKAKYQQEKEDALNALKIKLNSTSDVYLKYDICNKLFREYLHYQADSALVYIERKEKLLSKINDASLINETRINLAEVRGVTGMYSEALEELERVNTSVLDSISLTYYYKTCRACYGWLSDYTLDGEPKHSYLRNTDLYRDSILLVMRPCLEKDIVWAEKMLLNGDSELAMNRLQEYISNDSDVYADCKDYDQNRNYIYFTLSEVYKARNDRDNEIYYLTLTALADLKASICEYASLQKLAQLMYEDGNVSRAYKYLSRSMEDAVACNARLRFIEVTQFFPIIDNAYKMEEQHDKRVMRVFLTILSILGVSLVVVVLYLYRWMKHLAAVRRSLSMTNVQLFELNKKLEETGRIKDVYIARYLDRCVSYLNKLDAYRRSLVKYAMASRTEELFKAIKSEQFIHDERKNFYNEFDKSFLELFPDFVNAFNNLIVEEGRIYPKPGELLTPELRIFALIRLGVTDSNRIAVFLGYSLATIYNYRSKMRNKAKGSKEQFEQDVINLFTSL